MDYQRLFSDPGLSREFLDRFEEVTSSSSFEQSGLESLGYGPTVEQAAAAVADMAEGTWGSHDDGLEAIIRRFTRPVYLVQRSTFTAPADDFPESTEIARRVEAARTPIEAAIPSTGRIEVWNHRLDWLGTGWMVGPTTAVTNRHVAEEFARADRDLFAFRRGADGRAVRAVVDWRREYQRPEESRFRVEQVLWIEPETSFDVAVLRIADRGEDGDAPPPAIDLMTEEELRLAGVGAWVAVIGYPAQDSRNHAGHQQRIFDGHLQRQTGGAGSTDRDRRRRPRLPRRDYAGRKLRIGAGRIEHGQGGRAAFRRHRRGTESSSAGIRRFRDSS